MKDRIRNIKENFVWKDFWKIFLPVLLVATLLLVALGFGARELGGIRLFSGTDDLMEDLNIIVDPDSPFYEEFRDAKRMNLLMVGINQGLTDVIMVASLDLENKRVDLISVPRDTHYPRKGKSLGGQKINAVHRDEGIPGLATAVSDVLLGMPINYYAVVDYEGIKTMVDAVGGVPIDVEFYMHYEDPRATPPLVIDIEEGFQVLDGEKAVQYIRFRKGSGGSQGYREGDIGRIGTQQKFMKAAFAQGLEHGIVKTAKVVSQNVDSDVDVAFATRLARLALKMDKEDFQTHMVPGNSGPIGELSFWHANSRETEVMIREIYGMDSEV
jgi:LCP family protein required for cell wall assembly